MAELGLSKLSAKDVQFTKCTSETTRIVAQNEENWFSDWINDQDKICLDGKDDGHISLGETAGSFGKGMMGLVKAAVKHPLMTAGFVVGGVALTAATGGAALPFLLAAGVTVGTATVGYGVYQAATAKTDGEAKQAWETMGNGTFGVGASALGAGAALNAANKAGVASAAAGKLNPAQAVVQCFKSTPEALKVSGQNIKGNFLSIVHSKSIANTAATTSDGVTKNLPMLKDATSNSIKEDIIEHNLDIRKTSSLQESIIKRDAPFVCNIPYQKNNFYRMIGEGGYNDFLESGYIRPKVGSRYQDAYFQKGVSNSIYAKKGGNKFIVETDSQKMIIEEGSYPRVPKLERGKDSFRIWQQKNGDEYEIVYDSMNDIISKNPNLRFNSAQKTLGE